MHTAAAASSSHIPRLLRRFFLPVSLLALPYPVGELVHVRGVTFFRVLELLWMVVCCSGYGAVVVGSATGLNPSLVVVVVVVEVMVGDGGCWQSVGIR